MQTWHEIGDWIVPRELLVLPWDFHKGVLSFECFEYESLTWRHVKPTRMQKIDDAAMPQKRLLIPHHCSHTNLKPSPQHHPNEFHLFTTPTFTPYCSPPQTFKPRQSHHRRHMQPQSMVSRLHGKHSTNPHLLSRSQSTRSVLSPRTRIGSLRLWLRRSLFRKWHLSSLLGGLGRISDLGSYRWQSPLWLWYAPLVQQCTIQLSNLGRQSENCIDSA